MFDWISLKAVRRICFYAACVRFSSLLICFAFQWTCSFAMASAFAVLAWHHLFSVCYSTYIYISRDDLQSRWFRFLVRLCDIPGKSNDSTGSHIAKDTPSTLHSTVSDWQHDECLAVECRSTSTLLSLFSVTLRPFCRSLRVSRHSRFLLSRRSLQVFCHFLRHPFPSEGWPLTRASAPLGADLLGEERMRFSR